MEFKCAPVLLINFNRPDFTERQIANLRGVKPSRVFFAVDGPRADRPGEVEAVEKVRNLAKTIDWSCDVETLFQGKNLGCKYAPPAAISWFFDNVPEGIVLEDDIAPTEAFFHYATELLEKYRDSNSVGAITGFNRFDFQTEGTASYHFRTNMAVWGWASWRRAWRCYDVSATRYCEDLQEYSRFGCLTRRARKNFIGEVEEVVKGKLATWDYQWSLALMANRMLIVYPKAKLVYNLGVNNEKGAHTSGYDFDSRFIAPPPQVQTNTQFIQTLVHPNVIAADAKAQISEEERTFGLALRTFNWIGAKFPVLAQALDGPGHALERVCPWLFRI